VRVRNDWGGASAATTRVLSALHHRGRLRVARRENGIKVYALPRPAEPPLPAAERARAMLDLLLSLYAPLPEASFRELSHMVTESSLSPTLRARTFAAMLRDERVRVADVGGVRWLWPADESLQDDVDRRVRLLAPFDPVVWDRRRFAAFWGFEYRLEAYTPPAKRRFGYYALPLLWRDRVVGWANASVADGTLAAEIRYPGTAPRDAAFRRELAAEVDRLRDAVGARAFALRAA